MGVQLGIPNLVAASAGTRAVIGNPIHHESARVLVELGGDPSGFAARQLTAKIAAGADLILTMTTAHRDSVLELAPQKLHATFPLAECAQLASHGAAGSIADLAALRPYIDTPPCVDIPDPIGQAPEVFDTAGSHIAQLLPPILDFCRRATG